MTTAVEIDGLSKRYGPTVAADEVSFDVGAGEIFGLLGRNGAGKTTVLECVEGARRADRGRIRVLGLDPHDDARALRARIGVQLQRGALQERLRLREALDLFAALHPRPCDWRPLVARLGLAEYGETEFGCLSAGQRQRAFVALALIHHPEVVLLDELTTSLDPEARRAMWDVVRDIRDRGTTVLLATHFMDEAERLCDRVAIMSRGHVVALDAPAALVRRSGLARRLRVNASGVAAVRLTQIRGVDRVERDGDHLTLHGRGSALVGEVVAALTAMGIERPELCEERPSLEDVFLQVTHASSAAVRVEGRCEDC